MNKSTSKYKIIHDKNKNDYIIQTYNGSLIGWTFLTTKQSLEEALRWVNDEIIIEINENAINRY